METAITYIYIFIGLVGILTAAAILSIAVAYAGVMLWQKVMQRK